MANQQEIPRWVQTGILLPEDTEKYKRTDRDFMEQKRLEERKRQIRRALNNPVPSITNINSWLNSLDWSSESKIRSIIKDLSVKPDIVSKKAYILINGINDRIRYNPDDLSWYGWKGNAWHPYDSARGVDDLYLILTQGT